MNTLPSRPRRRGQRTSRRSLWPSSAHPVPIEPPGDWEGLGLALGRSTRAARRSGSSGILRPLPFLAALAGSSRIGPTLPWASLTIAQVVGRFAGAQASFDAEQDDDFRPAGVAAALAGRQRPSNLFCAKDLGRLAFHDWPAVGRHGWKSAPRPRNRSVLLQPMIVQCQANRHCQITPIALKCQLISNT